MLILSLFLTSNVSSNSSFSSKMQIWAVLRGSSCTRGAPSKETLFPVFCPLAGWTGFGGGCSGFRAAFFVGFEFVWVGLLFPFRLGLVSPRWFGLVSSRWFGLVSPFRWGLAVCWSVFSGAMNTLSWKLFLCFKKTFKDKYSDFWTILFFNNRILNIEEYVTLHKLPVCSLWTDGSLYAVIWIPGEWSWALPTSLLNIKYSLFQHIKYITIYDGECSRVSNGGGRNPGFNHSRRLVFLVLVLTYWKLTLC